MMRCLFTLLTLLTLQFSSQVYAETDTKKPELIEAHVNEVCTLVLRKLKASFKTLRTGNITDIKTGKVSDLLQSYRLLNCPDEKLLIDVLACTSTQYIFTDNCRNLPID